MTKPLFASILMLLSPGANGGVCDYKEPESAQDWVAMNMCHFKNTALVEIRSDYLREWYNPLTHFRPPNAYEYEVTVLDVFKGQGLNLHCMVQSTESTFRISAGIAGTKQIVSYDETGECVVIDVGAMQKATPELIRAARETAESLAQDVYGE